MNASFGFTLSTDWQKRCCNLERPGYPKNMAESFEKDVSFTNCNIAKLWQNYRHAILKEKSNPDFLFSREQEIANLSKVEVVEVWCGNLNAVLLLPALVSPVSFYFQILLWSILSEVKYGSRLQTLVWEEHSGVKCCGSLGRILIEFHFGKGQKPS